MKKLGKWIAAVVAALIALVIFGKVKSKQGEVAGADKQATKEKIKRVEEAAKNNDPDTIDEAWRKP